MVEPAPTSDPKASLYREYARVRSQSAALVSALSPEDQTIQSMDDASPAKWHLAHTTWFFETLLLTRFSPDYRLFDGRYALLFNSYYESLGPRHPRPRRGMLTRPSSDDVLRYRKHVDDAVETLCATVDGESFSDFVFVLTLGLNHEQQHQELLLTDIKHAFSLSPLLPAYAPARPVALAAPDGMRWIPFAGGIVEVGHEGKNFAFDNERPRHAVALSPFRLASRPVSCGEYALFIEDGGYQRPEFWLSDGFSLATREGWKAPLYWQDDGTIFTLSGLRPISDAEPVTHVSFYEAAAYAAWAGRRLATEFEWEHAATTVPVKGNFLESGGLHPAATSGSDSLAQMFGDVWEWTRSSYDPYPRYQPFEGAAAEYNGKFMVGQIVLRGGSCVTPAGHIRPTYRNFFPPASRWQFSGIRLAEDA
jgi:ergothioneine biosynthesis protein EgtB